MASKRPGRTRGGRIKIADMGAKAKQTSDTKWLHKMKRDHPAEFAEAMRRLEEKATK
jgi:hypothetical protein